jgi:lipopolysaccharide/colanic/teichoic acid biosynthesis glycosyltransferase
VWYRRVRRTIDLLFAGVLILLLTPVWIIAALAVKLSSPGPLLFTQPRGGLNGEPFKLYKFRTMRSDHVHDPTEIVPLQHSAITRTGRVLRRLKIDELPQLFNILYGDMTLIGPRPTIMDQVLAYDDFQKRRLEWPPGLTGLAQVNGSASMSWDERIKYDVYYVDHAGPWLDLVILLKTLPVVVFGEDRFARPFEQSPYGKRQLAESSQPVSD